MELRSTLSVILAAGVLVAGANVAVHAANGGPLLLGGGNTESKPTALKNTGAGPALRIKTRAAAPPLSVSSTTKVARLNADQVDGRSASDFEPAISPLAWTPITLAAGWTGSCFTDMPAFAVRNEIVYLRGDLCNGTSNSTIFTLPAEARPVRAKTFVYLTVDQCNAATGRIFIDTSTGVTGSDSDPQSSGADTCFISLEGVSYPR